MTERVTFHKTSSPGVRVVLERVGRDESVSRTDALLSMLTALHGRADRLRVGYADLSRQQAATSKRMAETARADAFRRYAELVAALLAADPSLFPADAGAQVLSTPEGADLYEQMMAGE